MKSQELEGERPALYRLEIIGHFRLKDGASASPHFYSDKVRALLVSLVIASPGRLSREQLIQRLWPRYRRPSALTSLRKALYELRRSLPDLTTLHANRKEIWLEHGGGALSCDWWDARALFDAVSSHNHAYLDGCGHCLDKVKALRALLVEEVCPELDVDEPEGFDRWRGGLRGGLIAKVDAVVQHDRTRHAYASLGNIPISEGPLQGREAYLRALGERIEAGEERLIALVGMGGIGKSHLARALARRCAAQFEDAIWLLSLPAYLPGGREGGIPKEESGWLARYVARMMGLSPGKGGAGFLERLRSHACLIVIDEFEWVLEGEAGERGGLDELKDVVEGMPRSQFVVTSRRSLGALGQDVRLPGLPLPLGEPPSQEEGHVNPGVALFLQVRGSRLDLPALGQGDVEQVAQVCNRLGGHPLGIKMAGALSQALPLPELVELVGQDPTSLVSPYRGGLPRHRTLDGLIGRMLESVSSTRALLLATLSLWKGPIFWEDVEPILGGHVGAEHVKDEMSGLSALCLLEPGNGHRFHALVREAVLKRIPKWQSDFEWADDLLGDIGDGRRSHFLRRFEWAYEAMVQGDLVLRQHLWLTIEDALECWSESLLRGDFDTLVRAIPGLILVSHEYGRLLGIIEALKALEAVLARNGLVPARLNVAVGLGIAYGHLGRSKDALEILLPLPVDRLSPRNRAWRAVVAGSHRLYTGEPEDGFALLQSCLDGVDDENVLDAEVRVFALSLKGMWKARTGQGGAEEVLMEALALSKRHQTVRFQAQIHTNLGGVYAPRGEVEKALSHLIQAREIAETYDLKSVKSSVLQALGFVYLDHGESEKALEAYEAALKLAKYLALPVVVNRCLQGSAHALYYLGRLEEALDYAEDALALCGPGTNALVTARSHLMVGTFLGDLGDDRALASAQAAYAIAEKADFWPTQCGADALRLRWALSLGDVEGIREGTDRLVAWIETHPGLPVASGLDWRFACYQGLAFLGDERQVEHLRAIQDRLRHQLMRLSSRSKRRTLAKGSLIFRRIIEVLRVQHDEDVDRVLGLA